MQMIGVQGRETGETDRAVLKARESQEGIDALLSQHERYIRSRISKFAPSIDVDELFTVASMAFFEAVRSYSSDKSGFYTFADMVMKRRLIDELRRRVKEDDGLLSLDEFRGTDVESWQIQNASVSFHRNSTQNEDVVSEIEQFVQELEKRGIGLDDLVRHAPKHATLKKNYEKIICAVLANRELCEGVMLKMRYPVKKISELTGFPQKKVDRSRIYVTAVIIIETGDYEILKGYFPFIQRGNDEVEK